MDTVEAPINDPEQFSYSGTATLQDKWWEAFNDPTLNTLIDSALTKNLNIATVWEQFQEAQAIRRRQASFYGQKSKFLAEVLSVDQNLILPEVKIFSLGCL